MFTGLIEDVGRVAALSRRGDAARLTVTTALPLDDAADRPDRIALGDSVAVNGVCLTVVAKGRGRCDFDVSAETLRRSNLGRLAVGARVNLERALQLGARLGGHLVQGHVDGVGALAARRQTGDFGELTYDVPAALLGQVVEKGSITLDGVSLTVARLEDPRVTIAVVPHTAAQTQLLDAAVGAPVNVETDLIGKYVQRALALTRPGDAASTGGLSRETLAALGYPTTPKEGDR